GGQGGVCRPRRRSGQARRGGDRGERRPGAIRGTAQGARGRGRGLRPASRGALRPTRRPRQQRRHPDVSDGGRGQCRELGRDPGREPQGVRVLREGGDPRHPSGRRGKHRQRRDRKSTRLNSSHVSISYAVFCLKKKKKKKKTQLKTNNIVVEC